MPDTRVRLGRIGAPHGVRGEVRVKSFTAEPAALFDYPQLEDETGRAFRVERWRAADTVFVVKFRGVDDRNAAGALTGTFLTLPRAALPATEEEEFYHADLIGLVAETTDGTPVGTIVAVQDFGAGDLLEVARPTGASVYVPFTRAVVPVVDVAGGRVVIEPPEGLLDGGRADDDGSDQAGSDEAGDRSASARPRPDPGEAP